MLRNCRHCGTEFELVNPKRIYCSLVCSKEKWNAVKRNQTKLKRLREAHKNHPRVVIEHGKAYMVPEPTLEDVPK